MSTTSTFGARAGALREDRLVMELAIRSGGAFDHTSCLMCQGYAPFAWRSVFAKTGNASLKQRTRNAAVKGGLNLWQIARRRFGAPARLWVAPDPALSTHLETRELAYGTDWAQVAQDCTAWGITQGLLMPPVIQSERGAPISNLEPEYAAADLQVVPSDERQASFHGV